MNGERRKRLLYSALVASIAISTLPGNLARAEGKSGATPQYPTPFVFGAVYVNGNENSGYGPNWAWKENLEWGKGWYTLEWVGDNNEKFGNSGIGDAEPKTENMRGGRGNRRLRNQ